MKKFLPYILILVILVGLFSPIFGIKNAQAASCTDTANTIPAGCTPVNWTPYQICMNAGNTLSTCSGREGDPSLLAQGAAPTAVQCTGKDANGNATPAGCVQPAANASPDSALTQNMKSCGSLTDSIEGCIQKIFFYIFYGIPSLLLIVAAKLFNAMIAITISGSVFASSTFVAKGWAVVRDLSNIFFILILLYTAIRLIVGAGEHDAKKTVIKVIFIGLILNFSMFFTQVVIDSSNVLALIFYNKLDVCTTVNGQASCAPYIPATSAQEKDLSGAMTKAFDPSQFLSQDFFTKLKEKTQAVPPGLNVSTLINAAKVIAAPIYSIPRAIYGYWFPSEEVPTSTIIAIILISGMIMLFAAYAFFIAALSFLSRLIELWILIVFSPFAFMSSTTSLLDDIDYIGWKHWLKRLITVSFMAPIFMFFLYFIFLLLQSNIFNDLAITKNRADIGSVETIILVLIPALVILILLMKASSFAKKSSGALGEMLIKGTEIAMGVVAGVGLGVAAKGLQMTAGQAASRLANNERLKGAESRGVFGAGVLRSVAKYGAKSSFDVRQGAVGGVLAAAGGISGLNLGHSSKLFKEAGGFEADQKKRIESRVARAKELELGQGSAEVQQVKQAESNLAAAKADRPTQERLLRLDEGNHHDEEIATANVNATVNTNNLADVNTALAANPADPALQELHTLLTNQTNAINALAVASANLASDPTNTILQATQQGAQTDLTNANNALNENRTAAAEYGRAISNLETANANLAIDPNNADLQTAQIQATNRMTAATNALAGASSPAAAQVMANREEALARQALAQGLGPIQRAANAGEKQLADATRRLENAFKQYGANSVEYNTALARQSEAEAERERTYFNLQTREGAKRASGGSIHRAEVELKTRQNAAIAASNQRRINYAEVVENSPLQNFAFINAGGRWAMGGTAQTVAADKIRAGVQAEQALPKAAH